MAHIHGARQGWTLLLRAPPMRHVAEKKVQWGDGKKETHRWHPQTDPQMLVTCLHHGTRPGKRLQNTNWKDSPCYFHGKTHQIFMAMASIANCKRLPEGSMAELSEFTNLKQGIWGWFPFTHHNLWRRRGDVAIILATCLWYPNLPLGEKRAWVEHSDQSSCVASHLRSFNKIHAAKISYIYIYDYICVYICVYITISIYIM